MTGKTRENITILDPTRHIETHIRDRGFTVSPEEIELLDKKIAHDLKPGDSIVFSGSLCLGLPGGYLGNLIERCNRQQARVAVDSNGEPLLEAARQRLWLLKPNVEELRQLVGAEVSDETAALRDAARALSRNVEHLLISRGANGALLLSGGGTCYAARTLSRRPAVRTVACGDHLLAGFVSEMAAGRDPARALTVAVAVASARAFSPRLDEFEPALLQAQLNDVVIEEI